MNKFLLMSIFAFTSGLLLAGCTLGNTAYQSTTMPDSATTAPATVSAVTPTISAKSYTLAEIATHKTGSNCWMAVDGKVYDVSDYVPAHPGTLIIEGCGKEASAMYKEVRKHTAKANAILKEHEIGMLK